MQMPGNDKSMMQSMSSTMGKINGMKMTGNFDVDFANMMIMCGTPGQEYPKRYQNNF